MRWQTKGVAKFVFNRSTHGNLLGDAACLLCRWKHYVTADQSVAEVIEQHVQRIHPEVSNHLGVQMAPEGDDAVDYFVITNPPLTQSA